MTEPGLFPARLDPVPPEPRAFIITRFSELASLSLSLGEEQIPRRALRETTNRGERLLAASTDRSIPKSTRSRVLRIDERRELWFLSEPR